MSTAETKTVFIPKRIPVPADAPAMRVNLVSPEEQAAQSAVDADVVAAFQEWKDAGSPSLFNKSPRQLYPIPKDEVERIDKDGRNGLERTIKYLNNAARLIPGCRIKIAKPILTADDGTALLYWVAKERKPRATTTASRQEAAGPTRRTTTRRQSSASEPASPAPQTSGDYADWAGRVPFRPPSSLPTPP